LIGSASAAYLVLTKLRVWSAVGSGLFVAAALPPPDGAIEADVLPAWPAGDVESPPALAPDDELLPHAAARRSAPAARTAGAPRRVANRGLPGIQVIVRAFLMAC
jgi:hypothetical protein